MNQQHGNITRVHDNPIMVESASNAAANCTGSTVKVEIANSELVGMSLETNKSVYKAYFSKRDDEVKIFNKNG